MTGLRGLVAVVAGAGMLAACSTAEPYGQRRLVAQPRPQVAVVARPVEPAVRVGPNGPMMTQRELEAERLRRMRDRVRTNPGLKDVVERYGLPAGDYDDVLRR